MKTSRPQAILLDFYGTVVEEIHLPVKVICEKVCRSSQVPVSEADFITYWVSMFTKLSNESYGANFKLLKEIEQQSLQAAIDYFKIKLNGAQLAHKLMEYRSHPQLFPESKKVLANLNIPVCLLTNIDNSDIQKALLYTGLSFKYKVTSEDCRAYKPRPEVFQKALSLVNLKPSEVLHVGDSYQGDILGAQSQNIAVLWIDRRKRPLPKGAKTPEYTASDLNGLTAVLS